MVVNLNKKPLERDGIALEQPAGHVSTFVRFAVGKLKSPSDSPSNDGASLAQQCLDFLGDKERFRPQLFVFLPTGAFAPYRSVLLGVRNRLADEGFGDVPLIGASVAVCLFDEDAYERGALLVCLGSRFIKAEAAVAVDAKVDYKRAVGEILESLKLTDRSALNPFNNRFLFTFLPGLSEDELSSDFIGGETVGELRNRTDGRLPMFGGVSCGGLTLSRGCQFKNDAVYDSAAVVALVECHNLYGLALADGLKEAGRSFRVTKSTGNGHVIEAFEEGTPEHIMKQIPAGWFLGEYSADGEHKVGIPRLVGNKMHLRRSFTDNSVLHLLQPDTTSMVATTRNVLNRERERLCLKPSRLAGLFGIGCVGRYKAREKIGLDVRQTLRCLTGAYPGMGFAGCYMEGEIGVMPLGCPVLGNWSVSMAFFGDDIADPAEALLGYDLFEQRACESEPQSLDEALNWIVRGVGYMGFPGAMVSLVMSRDRNERWIIARHAFGKQWEDVIKPRTQRPLPGGDILAIVAREGKSRFVKDSNEASECCHLDTVHAAGTMSQYVMPLRDPQGMTLAVLQVDLGDMRDTEKLGGKRRAVLEAIGRSGATMLGRVIHTDELKTSRLLDKAFIECLSCESEDLAVRQFTDKASKILDLNAHSRLLDDNGKNLRLVGGRGDYFTLAWTKRKVIEIDDASPSAEVLRTCLPVYSNDTKGDSNAMPILRQYQSDTPLGQALRNMRAFADFPIMLPNQKPEGLVSFYSNKPWIFTESTFRSLADIGQRLCVLLTHIRQRLKGHRLSAEAGFLREITPQLDPNVDLHTALRNQAAHTMAAARADVVSFFLWDDIKKRFILRAQAGWANTQWVDVARYRKQEGMTGTLALSSKPEYIEDVRTIQHSTPSGYGKYVELMFGGALPDEQTCEVIVLPLSFAGGSIGVVTMHRRRSSSVDGHITGFATTERHILQEAAECLSIYVAALDNYDRVQWQYNELRKIAHISSHLLEDTSSESMLKHACHTILKEYAACCCAIYLVQEDRKTLLLKASSKADNCTCKLDEHILPKDVEETRNPLWQSFVTGTPNDVRSAAGTDKEDLTKVSDELRITRICLPLRVGHQVVGSIDVRWEKAPPTPPDEPVPRHDIRYWEFLAAAIASAIGAQRLRHHAEGVRRERSVRGLHAMSSVLQNGFHDLAQGIQGIGDGLLNMKSFASNAELREIIEDCVCTVERITNVLRRARDAGNRLAAIRESPCRLDNLLQEALNKCRSKINDRNITLKCSPKGISANVDPGLVMDCFEYVVDNAVKFTPNGGQVEVFMRSNGEDCEVLVTDRGQGMTEETIARVSQGERVDTEARGGGMGLFLTRLYLGSHGGDLQIESSPGTGTTVKLIIPIKESGGVV
ncbi:MAG: hypothetical protein HZA88_20530 [Verrucomicrobia bacterium]|nr:hypothetical protein [Verrucomicrobiota bacterium]